MTPDPLNRISSTVIEAAIEVHRTLGPGLLESVYRPCLIYELRQRELKVVAEQTVPLVYKNLVFDGVYRFDVLVNDSVIVEIKAVDFILSVHQAQLLSYPRLMKKPLGLLINFNVSGLVQGVRRVMNGAEDSALNSRRDPINPA